MPAYNFQWKFVRMIPERKWHTVRRKRKHPTKVGDALYLYTGMRTKQCRLIVELPCLFIKPIKIYPDEMQVVLDGIQLSVDEINSFFYHDGFDNAYDFFDFFRRYSPEIRENELEVIYWMEEEEIGVCSLGYDWRRG